MSGKEKKSCRGCGEVMFTETALLQARELQSAAGRLAETLDELHQSSWGHTLIPFESLNEKPSSVNINEIQHEFAPYMSREKILAVLMYYGRGRTEFRYDAHTYEYSPDQPIARFHRRGLRSVFERFLDESTIEFEFKTSKCNTQMAVLYHVGCFDSETVWVPKGLAIKWLGLSEADFQSR